MGIWRVIGTRLHNLAARTILVTLKPSVKSYSFLTTMDASVLDCIFPNDAGAYAQTKVYEVLPWHVLEHDADPSWHLPTKFGSLHASILGLKRATTNWAERVWAHQNIEKVIEAAAIAFTCALVQDCSYRFLDGILDGLQGLCCNLFVRATKHGTPISRQKWK
eukprot:1152482-Pelagomonas_calceolata.AAC.2